ncbi:DsbA family protein [Radiobacillus deserti]|uniref:DsbA family protein n=1 Tax=Radiobacillus deserti TaxID=2594883 RepID=A0A516KD80_9BACI|nr:DsbA family protein [Radiobacillus deserti]QDP39358.1 DsbA family protein [Radiobacillus deserti]
MKDKKKSPIQLMVILTIVLIVLIVSLVVLNNKKENTEGVQTFDQAPSIEGQPTLGDSDAPVTVVEFGDFKCPSCKAWGESVYPQLVKDYVDTGKVKFSFINVLFHGEESERASLAAEAVYQQSPEDYWTFHKALFSEQPEDHSAEWVTIDKMLEVAETIPTIDGNQLESSMQSEEIAEKVQRDAALVEEFNVELTPTIMINNKMVEDPFDYEKIKSVIEEALEEN